MSDDVIMPDASSEGERASRNPDTGSTPDNESARVSRLSSPGAADTSRARVVTDSADDAVVREYETRYRRTPPPESDYMDVGRVPPRGERALPTRRNAPRSYSTLSLSDDDRLWAAVAHGSVWLTLFAGVISAGTIVPLSIFIPLIIFFIFRKRSDYVAFHALQAFTLQLVGTLGALVLGVVGGIVWGIGMIVALVLMLVLVGFILVPVWGVVGILLGLVVALMPVVMLILGTIAAIETYNGRDYRYPRIAGWVDRQLAGSYMHHV
jgi:uncharacterized Tic20 family protein